MRSERVIRPTPKIPATAPSCLLPVHMISRCYTSQRWEGGWDGDPCSTASVSHLAGRPGWGVCIM